MYEKEEMVKRITPVGRGGLVPSWLGRIGWGSVLAGTVVMISVASVLTGIGIFVGLVTTTIVSLDTLSAISVGVGVWTLVSILASFFLGGYVAATLARARSSSDGLWHGFVLWALPTGIGVLLFAIALLLTIVLGGITALAITGIIAGTVIIPPASFLAADNIATRVIGFFILASLLGLVTSLLGGWAGSGRMSAEEARTREEETYRRRTA